MESGFYYPFDTPRHIDAGKREVWALSRKLKQLGAIDPSDRGCVIRFNSTYLDMIDRWYTVRGGVRSAMLLLMSPLAVVFTLIGFYFTIIASRGGVPLWELFIGVLVVLALPVVFIRIAKPILGREFFGYTHYPIRFNRKTRMIHVFRHHGPGGVLSVPWDEVFFHIGQGTQDRDCFDLRGHVMDGDTVLDTFAVGDFSNREASIRQGWKFLVLYMEQGPQALRTDTVMMTSTSKCWRNCFFWSRIFCSVFIPVPIIKWGFLALVVGARWLIMQTCKDPVWPPEIEAESVIEPDDPYRLPEPRFTGDLTAGAPNVWTALQARALHDSKKHGR